MEAPPVFFFFPVYYIYLFERDPCATMYPCHHDWSQRTTWRNRFSLLPRSSGIKLRPSTLAASAWATELSQALFRTLVMVSLCFHQDAPFPSIFLLPNSLLSYALYQTYPFCALFQLLWLSVLWFPKVWSTLFNFWFCFQCSANFFTNSLFNPPHGFYTCPFNPLYVLHRCVSDTPWLAPLWETVPVASCFLNFQCGFFAHHFGYSDGVWHSMSIYDKPHGKTFSLINI